MSEPLSLVGRKPTPPVQIALLRKNALADTLGVSTWTIDRWVKQRKFPKPIRLTDRSPAMWRVRDVEAWLMKRQVARIKPPPYQGAVRRQMGGDGAR
jgi:predicted DNA-binding transcriptional regulator AlpA